MQSTVYYLCPNGTEIQCWSWSEHYTSGSEWSSKAGKVVRVGGELACPCCWTPLYKWTRVVPTDAGEWTPTAAQPHTLEGRAKAKEASIRYQQEEVDALQFLRQTIGNVAAPASNARWEQILRRVTLYIDRELEIARRGLEAAQTREEVW